MIEKIKTCKNVVIEKINTYKSLIKKYVIILIVSLFLEIFLFNISSFRTLIGNYEVKVCDEPEFLYYSDDGDKAYLKFDNINTKTVTVKLEISGPEMVTEYNVFYSDATTSSHIGGFSKRFVSGNEKTKYMPLYLSGETNSLIIEVNSKVYDSGYLKYISVNEKIPFEFNKARFLITFIIIATVYFMRTSEFFKKDYSKKDFWQEAFLLCILGVFLFIASYLNSHSINQNELEFYSQNFVDSLMQGSVALLDETSEEFEALEDPYDTQERSSVQRDEDYIWDTAYYNGKQYVYFGILPMLIMFLPYYIITKKYLSMSVCVFVFSVLCFILLKEILLKILNKFFNKIPFKLVIYFFVTLCSGSLILYMNGIHRVYEMAIVSALYFVLQGIYFILEAEEKEEKKYKNIFLGSLFLALAVACRPISLFASLLILPYLIYLLIENIKKFKEDKISIFKLILAVAIPYLTVGAFLMWYNYVRFGNVFEFGAKYQLTIINMKELGSRIFAIPIGIFTNLFSIPNFISEFPYIENHNKLSVFYGYYYIENMIGGLFIVVPLVFMNFGIYKANKIAKDNKKLKIVLNSLFVVGIFICIVSVMMAGSNQRYLVDYAWMLILSAILIFCILYNSLKSGEAKKILQKILCYITVYTFLISIASGIISEKDYMKQYSMKEYYNLRYTICFWE